MEVIYAYEKMPEKVTKSLFLAGPTPRNSEEVSSWRPDALKILEDKGYDGVVYIPEPRDGKFSKDYDAQVAWEEEHLNAADCIVFWVPRDLSPDTNGFPKMAALTTNVEWGFWVDSGKVVFGAPEEAEKVTYLKYYAEKCQIPIADTLTETLDNALEMLGNGAAREDGARYVPLFIWNLPSFQSWYQAQTKAGNQLKDARLIYNFRPGYKKFVFLWILKVNVWIESEQRNKTNEFVLARPDISTVLLHHISQDALADGIAAHEVVLIKEFRSPASTEDGFIRELPGGSSIKLGVDPEVTAAEEVHEETGFYLDPTRLEFQGALQLAGTLSSHKSYLYSSALTDEEIKWFKAQENVVHGNLEDSERTFIEVYKVADLLKNNLLDWSTLGMILSVLEKNNL